MQLVYSQSPLPLGSPTHVYPWQDLNLQPPGSKPGALVPLSYRGKLYEPGGSRTPNLRIKSPPLCLLSYRSQTEGAGAEGAGIEPALGLSPTSFSRRVPYRSATLPKYKSGERGLNPHLLYGTERFCLLNYLRRSPRASGWLPQNGRRPPRRRLSPEARRRLSQ